MTKDTTIRDYGFGRGVIHSTSYLCDPVITALQRLGAHRVLDIGCGNGSLTRMLVKEGFDVTGVEPSCSGVSECRRIMPESVFYQARVEDDPDMIKEYEFDAAVASEVVEHLYEPRKLLLFASAKLRPGGYVLLTTPYHGYLKNMMLSLFNKWDFHHMPLRDGGHIKFWSVATLRSLFAECGFEVVEVSGCGRCPYLWKSMLMIGQKHVELK